jgi:hypothetical protein
VHVLAREFPLQVALASPSVENADQSPMDKISRSTFGVHLGHDAALAIQVDGVVLAVLELERLFEVRSFFWGGNPRIGLGSGRVRQRVSRLCPGAVLHIWQHGRVAIATAGFHRCAVERECPEWWT